MSILKWLVAKLARYEADKIELLVKEKRFETLKEIQEKRIEALKEAQEARAEMLESVYIENRKQLAESEHEFHQTKEERGITLAKLEAQIEEKTKCLRILDGYDSAINTRLQKENEMLKDQNNKLIDALADIGKGNVTVLNK